MAVFEQIKEQVKELLPGAAFEEKERSVSVTAELDAGVKGILFCIDYTDSILKINGIREYKYPIREKEADTFQDETVNKYSDYTVYVSGQTLNISRYCMYNGADEAVSVIKEAIAMAKETVASFENTCVDFQERVAEDAEAEEYDPEKNVNIMDVDNSYFTVPTTERDVEEDAKQHSTFARTAFLELAQAAGVEAEGDTFLYEEDGLVTECTLLGESAEIQVKAGIHVSQDVSAMYESYAKENYPELLSAYDQEEKMFTVRGFSYPDQYDPEGPANMVSLCQTAVHVCMKEYEQTLTKKDSAQFASDIQQVLSDQAAAAQEREKALNDREAELEEAFAKVQEKEAELKQRIADLEAEKAEHETQMQEEREQLKAREEQMQEEIRQYEQRNTSDILKIQKLANEVAALQNRQKALGNGGDGEEAFRLKSKVQQLTSQKVMLEKKLTEKVNAKESRIRELSGTLKEKELKIREMETSMGDQAKSIAAKEAQGLRDRIAQMEQQMEEIGHILTPEDMIAYLQRDPELHVRKLHSATARFVAWQDGQLDIRIRFGKANYIDVACEATLKDAVLKKLNAKATGVDGPDIKFFTKDKRIIARAYFGQTASVEDVGELADAICVYFNK